MKPSPGDDAASIGRFADAGVTRRNGRTAGHTVARHAVPTTPGLDRATGTGLPDLQQLAAEISQLAMRDAAAATRHVRELMASLPEACHGELAAGVAGRLDDATLHALSQGSHGRDLLVALASRAHEQIGRLSDALYAVVRRAG